MLQSNLLGFQEGGSEHLGRAVENADRLLVGSKPADASAAVELGKRVSGEVPELLFRQGMADLASDNPTKGIEGAQPLNTRAAKPHNGDGPGESVQRNQPQTYRAAAKTGRGSDAPGNGNSRGRSRPEGLGADQGHGRVHFQ